MRVYLDEMFSPVIAALLRAQGIDAVSALELGHSGTADNVHLLIAAQERRAIVTRNYSHFATLTIQFGEMGYPHAGVILVPASLPNEDFGGIAAALIRFNGDHPDGIPLYSILWLQPAPNEPNGP